MEKTEIEWQQESKFVILKCSDKLWDYLQKLLRNSNLENLDLLTLMKVYKEIKSLDLNSDKEKKENGN